MCYIFNSSKKTFIGGYAEELSMSNIPFDEKELEIVSSVKNGPLARRRYARPITEAENMRRTYYEKDPVWIPSPMAGLEIDPMCIPDNIARGMVRGAEHIDNDTEAGGPDMYGVIWEYSPKAGGSMVVPGSAILDDVNDWKEVIRFPDVDSWDWEGSAKANAELLASGEWITTTLYTGAWFERLISFMDFENAAVALIDEDQEDALQELLTATTDVICKVIDKIAEYFPQMNLIRIHDDWGGQEQPFFSKDTAMDVLVPHMKRTVDHIHSKGMIADLHSCGHNETRVECYIAAGWDSWSPQPMNDYEKLFREYGDQIMFGIRLEDKPADDEAAVRLADELADKFIVKGRPIRIGAYFDSEAFEKELYRRSRLGYLE